MATAYNTLDQLWNVILENALYQKWGNAKVSYNQLNQWWTDALLINKTLNQLWGDSTFSYNQLNQLWLIYNTPYTSLNQVWSILDTKADNQLGQYWDIKDKTDAMNTLIQYWNLQDDSTNIVQIDASVIVDGVQLQTITNVNLSLDEGAYAISGKINLKDKSEFLGIQAQANVSITYDGVEYTLFVDNKEKNRSISEDYTEDYTLNLLSPTAALDAPYCVSITKEYTGLASDIIREILDDSEPSIGLSFEAQDFFISELKIEDSTPIDAIANVKDITGLLIQTSPSGDLIIRKEIPVSPTLWETATADKDIIADIIYSENNSEEIEAIYNYIEVTDTDESDYTISIESEDIDSFTKHLKVYEVPFSGSNDLEDSGGSWVQTTSNGIKTETIIDKNVEVVDGVCSTTKPIYELIDYTYLQSALGSIEYEESGSISTNTYGNSLMNIEYITKYYSYNVTDNNNESVQFYIKEDE